MKTYAYTVKPTMRFSRFPTDMLRYDRAWPVGPNDVSEIDTEPKDRPEGAAVSIRLNSNHQPTADRWSSFGWTVSDVSSTR